MKHFPGRGMGHVTHFEILGYPLVRGSNFAFGIYIEHSMYRTEVIP